MASALQRSDAAPRVRRRGVTPSGSRRTSPRWQTSFLRRASPTADCDQHPSPSGLIALAPAINHVPGYSHVLLGSLAGRTGASRRRHLRASLQVQPLRRGTPGNGRAKRQRARGVLASAFICAAAPSRRCSPAPATELAGGPCQARSRARWHRRAQQRRLQFGCPFSRARTACSGRSPGRGGSRPLARRPRTRPSLFVCAARRRQLLQLACDIVAKVT